MNLEDLMTSPRLYGTPDAMKAVVAEAYALGYVHADNGIPEQLEEEHEAWVAVGDVVR